MNKNCAIGIDFNGIEHRYEINSVNNIWCRYTKLKTLTVFDEDNKLNELNCYENQLESLIIHGGKNILEIHCENNNLKQLDLSMCGNLLVLFCDIQLENNIKLPKHKIQFIYYE